jgi:hypothetical protein
LLIVALAQTSSSSSAAVILNYVFYLIFIGLFFVLSMPGIGQRFQMSFAIRDIEGKLSMLEKFANDSKVSTENLLKEKGAKDPKGLTERLAEIFTIDPVNVEPTDIIPRMRLLLRTTENKVRDLITMSAPGIDNISRSKIEMSAEVTNALNMVYKIVRHYLITAKKLNNIFLVYQLQMVVPQLVKQAEAYVKAQKTFIKGIPIGDSFGPMVASRFLMKAETKREVSRDTVAGEVYFEGRKLTVIKAKGPMATVGTPGEAVAKVVEENQGKVARIITVDAALRLEGEKTGSIAEGTGVAMGDPGPEKIEIERIAVKYGIPIDALISKMSIEEAITEMRKEIYDAVEPMVEMVKQLIRERTREGDHIVIVGVGNTIGVAQ